MTSPASTGTEAATLGCGTRFERRRQTALGTYVELLVAGDPTQADEADRVLRAELDAVDRACSRFRADSELSRANARAGQSVSVSPLLGEAVAAAVRAAAQTDGDVDPTLGHDLVAAGYDRDFALLTPVPTDRPAGNPTAGRAGPRRQRWGDVEVDAKAATLRIPAGIALDLGATAKALAADRCAMRLGDLVDCAVLVNLGGDIALGGPAERAPRGGWPVRLVERAPGTGGPVVRMHSGGLATSSTVMRTWRRGSTAYHHILDPRTGQPTAPVWRMVTVAAATCVDANTASTASVVRGEAAIGWLTACGLPSRLVDAHGVVHRVAGWPEDGPA